MSELELCLECEAPTGKAGIHEDSNYAGYALGPYCDDCFAEIPAKYEEALDEIAALRAVVRDFQTTAPTEEPEPPTTNEKLISDGLVVEPAHTVDPEPPCDCIYMTAHGWHQECDCRNSGDLAAAESWCCHANLKAPEPSPSGGKCEECGGSGEVIVEWRQTGYGPPDENGDPTPIEEGYQQPAPCPSCSPSGEGGGA